MIQLLRLQELQPFPPSTAPWPPVSLTVQRASSPWPYGPSRQ